MNTSNEMKRLTLMMIEMVVREIEKDWLTLVWARNVLQKQSLSIYLTIYPYKDKAELENPTKDPSIYCAQVPIVVQRFWHRDTALLLIDLQEPCCSL